MPDIQCFMLDEIDMVRTSLRRFSFGAEKCPSVYGYHNAEVHFCDLPHNRSVLVDCDELERAHTPPRDDARWPRKCGCGYEFKPSDEWQLFIDRLYKRSDTGAILTVKAAGPGAMWFASWAGFTDNIHHAARGGGPHLLVKLPDGRTWDIDSKSSNGTGWTRNGQPPLVVASPSILTEGYHGYLGGSRGERPGFLVECP